MHVRAARADTPDPGRALLCGALAAWLALLLAAAPARADAVREAVESRARERAEALDADTRADYVALVLRVFDGFVDRNGYYESQLVGFEIADAALRRIEQDRATAAQNTEAFRIGLLSAIESGEIRFSAEEISLADPTRAATFVWRNVGMRLAQGIGDESIEPFRESGRRRPSGYRALDPSGRALITRLIEPETQPPALPSTSAVLAEVDWRRCVDAERLRPRLLERYAEQGRESGLEAGAAKTYAQCLSGRVIAALEQHDRAPSSRFPPLNQLGPACRAEGTR